MRSKYKNYIRASVSLVLILFSQITFSQNENFEGYYIEVIYMSGKYNELMSGQFIITKDSLNNLLTKPQKIWEGSIDRLHNYTSKTFSFLELKLPFGVKEIEQINWNKKVSLYRGNDEKPYHIYKSKIDDKYAFYIKKVNIIVESIGSTKELISKVGSSLRFQNVDMQEIMYESIRNYLLINIIQQKLIENDDIIKLNLSDLIEPVCLKEANNIYHPFFTKSQIGNPRKSTKYNCNYPIDW